MSELTEAGFAQDEVAELAKQEPDFLAGLAMPEVFEYCWPPVFLAVWAWLREQVDLDRAFQLLALGLPRGFGKTTVVKLFILYCVLFTNRQFILIMSATATLAENIISDVADMLDERNIKQVFGDWNLGLEKNTNAVKKFGFRGRNIIIAGLGAGGSVRGLNMKNARPDVMIFEDVQSRESADSQEVSDKLYKWMLGTAMKAKSPKGCLTLFIGNMYPTPHSILKKLKANPNWIKFIAGGILENGQSLWEELQPIRQLLKEYQNDVASGHPEIFHSEVLNDENAAVNNLVDFSRIKPYPYEDDDIHQGNFIIIDPSNDKTNSDSISTCYFEMFEGLPAVKEIDEGRYSPGDAIMLSIQMALKHNCSLVVIEANAYQYSLKYWSEFVCRQLGIVGINFVPIYSGKLSKNSRILTMFKSYANGEILIHPTCEAQVKSQIISFNPLKTNNVDGILDCLTYAPRVVEEMAEFIKISTIEGQQEFAAISADEQSVQANSPF
ncbi:hypothetical protein D3C87_725640 [compost metagenome]